MSKQINPKELAKVLTDLLLHPERVGQDFSPQGYSELLTGLAQVVCDQCGGEVAGPASEIDGQWLVGIRGNDSLPEDGGIWKNFDLEGALYEGSEVEEPGSAESADFKDLTCPNCSMPVVGDQDGCVVGSLFGILRERGELEESEVHHLHANCDLDRLWDKVGRLVDELGEGDFLLEDESADKG